MDIQSNLFTNIFQWKPTDSKTSAENFLTEAFVYCLCVNDDFRQSWLKKILGREIYPSDLSINTRASHIDDERATTIFPDIEITGRLANGEAFLLLVEVKWGAPYHRQQLRKYARLMPTASNRHLIFVSSSAVDSNRAKRDYESGEIASPARPVTFHAFSWSDIHSQLRNFSENCRTTRELEEFMHQQGLSAMQPISSSLLSSYLATKDFTARLKRYCEKLLHEYKWDFLPDYYQTHQSQAVKDQYGRVAIVLMRPGWNGTITIGFLYSNHDHGVKFANGSDNSVDLMLRIEAFPQAKGRDRVLQVLENKTSRVREAGGIVRLAGDVGNTNQHTLLIAQRSFSEFLAPSSEVEQLANMRDQIEKWLRALFDGGDLEAAIAAFGSETR